MTMPMMLMAQPRTRRHTSIESTIPITLIMASKCVSAPAR